MAWPAPTVEPVAGEPAATVDLGAGRIVADPPEGLFE